MRVCWGLLPVSICFGLAAYFAWQRGAYLPGSIYPWFVPAVTIGLGLVGAVPLVILIRQIHQRRSIGRPFVLAPGKDSIPQQEGHTYVGMGYPWTFDHSKSLLELSLKGELDKLRYQGGSGSGHYIHGVGKAVSGEKSIFIPNGLLSHHSLIVGTTGAGKTRLLELLIRQAILRGESVIVVDPKGDPDRRLLRRMLDDCRQSGRMDDFRMFDLMQPKKGLRYNPLKNFVYPKQLVSRIVAALPATGEAASFRDFAYKVVSAVVHALHALNRNITLARIYEYSDSAERLVREFLRERYGSWVNNADKADVVRELIPQYEERVKEGLIDRSPELEEVIKIARHPKEHLQKMISNLFPLFSKLCTGMDAELLSNDDPDQEELSWEEVDRQKQVAYVYLGSNTDVERATAVGRMLLLDLQSYLGGKYAYAGSGSFEPINIFVDELHEVLTEEFVSVLNQARGAGFRITMGTQSFADLEHVLKSRPAAERILGNANVLLQLHVEQERDAQVLPSRCGRRLASLASTNITYEPGILKSGKHDVEDFRSKLSYGEKLQEIDLVPSWAIQELPVGHYFGRWGASVYKGVFPFLPEPRTTEGDLERVEYGRLICADAGEPAHA